jgi:hypothetical protein
MIDGIRREELEKATSGQSSHVCCPIRLRCRPRRIYPAAFRLFFYQLGWSKSNIIEKYQGGLRERTS